MTTPAVQEPEAYLAADPLPGWRFLRDRLLPDEDVIEVTWLSPEGEVVMRWPVEASEA